MWKHAPGTISAISRPYLGPRLVVGRALVGGEGDGDGEQLHRGGGDPDVKLIPEIWPRYGHAIPM